MSHWVLFVAPLALASFVMLFAFVGCGLNSEGTQSGEEVEEDYATTVSDTPNLVSYWRLGEESGTTADDSKDGNDGTYVGGVTLGEPGLLVSDTNTAALFDGSTGFVSVPRNDDSLNPSAFTVEALVSLAGGGGGFRAVVSSRDVDPDVNNFGYVLQANDQGNWEARVGSNSPDWQIVSGPAATEGTHYLAMTYDGKTLKLYVDPAEDTTASLEAPYVPNAQQELRIGAGANETDPADFFPGVIDEVAVYSDALPFETIRSHFELATKGPNPG